MVDALAKEAYGKTFAEVDTALGRTIVFLFSEMKVSIEQIAEKVELETQFVIAVLKKNKLIKNKK